MHHPGWEPDQSMYTEVPVFERLLFYTGMIEFIKLVCFIKTNKKSHPS